MARLSTGFWVSACIYRSNRQAISLAVTHKGDPTAGAVLVKMNRREEGCVVLAETRDTDDRRAWFRATGPLPVSEEAADSHIERAKRRDPDLWVLEIDDRDQRLPFDERILID